MKKSILFLIAILMLVLALPVSAAEDTHAHPACGPVCTHETPCETVEYERLSGINLTTGNYYMYSDTDSTTRTVKSGSTVRICLNGHTMAFNNSYLLKVEEGAVLEICDCQGSGTVRRYYGTGKNVVANYGTMTIYGGTYGVWGSQGVLNYGTMEIHDGSFNGTLTNHGDVVIHNATLTANAYQTQMGIDNKEEAELTVYDGTFDASWIVLFNDGQATIKGGDFTSESNNAIYNGNGRVWVHDGSFTAGGENAALENLSGYWSFSYSYPGARIMGGTFRGYIGILNNGIYRDTSESFIDGYCHISGGTILGSHCGVVNSGSTWTDDSGYKPKEITSKGLLELSGSPTISKVRLEYPDALRLNNLENNVDLEFDMTRFSEGSLVCNYQDCVSKLHVLNEGYLLAYSSGAGGAVLKSNNCGKDGADVRWEITEDNVLRIYGQGEMDHFGFSAYQPWHSFADRITAVVVEPGVTSIGEAAFSYLSKMAQISIPETVTHIHDYSLEGNNALEKIVFPKNLEYIGNAFAIHGNPTAQLFYDGCEHMWALVQQGRGSFTVTCKDYTAEDDGDCTTAVLCSVCDKVMVEGQPSHTGGTATCTQKAACALCGKIYGEYLPHSWVDATCTAAKYCSACGKTEGNALGHNWNAATCTTPKTCTRCALTEGTALGHKWTAATCTTPKTCSVCKKTEGAALGHKWTAATCTAPKTCSVCKKTEGAALGHKWTTATCTAPKTCSVCKLTEGAALGHKWTAATCTTPKTCSVCKLTEGAALGHKWTAATCTAPKTCSVCKLTEGAALGHKWNAATCTTPKTCSVCKLTEGAALGHKWTAATCTAPKTCSVCKVTEGAALGHKWTAATCTTPKT